MAARNLLFNLGSQMRQTSSSPAIERGRRVPLLAFSVLIGYQAGLSLPSDFWITANGGMAVIKRVIICADKTLSRTYSICNSLVLLDGGGELGSF